MSLKQYIKDEMKAEGFADTEANDKLAKIIANAIKKYLNNDVQADISGGSSAGTHKLVAS